MSGYDVALNSLHYWLNVPTPTLERWYQQNPGSWVSPERERDKWMRETMALQAAHVFEFPADVVRLLVLTDNKVESIQLPYDQVFIDAKFSIPLHVEDKELHYVGLLLSQTESMRALGQAEAVAFTDGSGREYLTTRPGGFAVDTVYPIGPGSLNMWGSLHIGDGLKKSRASLVEHRALQNLCMNFLNLLETPDVMLIPLKSSHRRERKGLTPYAAKDRVILRPNLRRYLDDLRSSGQSLDHRFWVRGHFAHWRAERYKEARGKKTWIWPYIKGQGLLVQKRYRLPGDYPPEEVTA